jgi:hypothetical protein
MRQGLKCIVGCGDGFVDHDGCYGGHGMALTDIIDLLMNIFVSQYDICKCGWIRQILFDINYSSLKIWRSVGSCSLRLAILVNDAASEE